VRGSVDSAPCSAGTVAERFLPRAVVNPNIVDPSALDVDATIRRVEAFLRRFRVGLRDRLIGRWKKGSTQFGEMKTRVADFERHFVQL